MAQSVQSPEPLRATTPTDPNVNRLRTVTGNKFPRKCACGRGAPIPRDSLRCGFRRSQAHPRRLRKCSATYTARLGGLS